MRQPGGSGSVRDMTLPTLRDRRPRPLPRDWRGVAYAAALALFWACLLALGLWQAQARQNRAMDVLDAQDGRR